MSATNMKSTSKRNGRKSKMLIAITIQLLCLSVLVFGDIGFDKPVRFGLSFNHSILLSVEYVVAFICGVWVAIALHRWPTASFQLIVPITIVVFMSRPAPVSNAADYQIFVGMQTLDVERQLSSRFIVSGSSSDEHGERRMVSYRGMTISTTQSAS